MILIFTNKQDTHTDEVIKSLGRRGIEVFRLNSEDLILKYRIEVLTDNSGNWHGTIEDETNRVLNLDAIRVAWLRKPDFDFATTDDASTEVQDFIYSETKTFIQLLYSLPNITWINDPFIANKSKVKFQQLLLAAKFGVSIPKTLVTNRPSAAQKFFLNCGETALTKAIYTGNVTIDGINQGIPSKQINKQEFYDHLDNISLCVTQLQEYVEKAFELRVTVIGEKVFAVMIDSQKHEETRIDWRVNTRLNPHSIFQLPKRIEIFCVEFLKSQALHYGAMDFIITPDGDFVFLENNPFGQYLWLEVETGLPLTEELCNLLVNTVHRR